MPESDIGSNTENLLRMVPCNVFIAGRGMNPEDIIKAAPDSLPDIEWTEGALTRLEKVPPFARGMAKKAVEDFARENGHSTITDSVMDNAVRKLLPPSARRAMGIDG